MILPPETGADRIRVRGISAHGRHGVLEHEKRHPQPFVVDLDLDLDLAPAGRSDDLDDTLSYAQVAADVVAVVEGPTVDLIESLAQRIADVCLRQEALDAVTVTVHKPHAPVGTAFGDVAVQVVRRRCRPAVIALGANLADPEHTLRRALTRLQATPGIEVGDVSDLFDTAPVGGPAGQPRYLNAVATVTTSLSGRTLLARLHEIEDLHGRRRDVRWGPRTLDLDIVQIGDPVRGDDLVCDSEHLRLPHPRAHERGFVLAPWDQIDPDAHLRRDVGVVPVSRLLASVAPELFHVRPLGRPRWWLS